MKNKKVLLFVIGALLLTAVGISISYAYYIATVSQQGENVVKTDCFALTYEDEGAITLSNTFPIRDSEANTVTPYHLKIKNVCSLPASYQVNLEMLSDSTLDIQYLNYKLDNGSITALSSAQNASQITLQNATLSKEIATGNLLAGEEAEYDLRVWLKESVTTNDPVQNKTFKSKVVVIATLNKNLLGPGYTVVSGNLDTMGSLVKIGDEEFYVIGQEDSTHVKLISKWVLNVGENPVGTATGLQAKNYDGYWPDNCGVPFAATNYWYDSTNNRVKDEYTGNASNPYVYDENSNLYQYVENYVTYLKSYGVNVTGRLLMYNEFRYIEDYHEDNYDELRDLGLEDFEWRTGFYWLGDVFDGNDAATYVRAYESYSGTEGVPYTELSAVKPVIILEK